MEKLRAVIYIRVSDPSQIENCSLETQLKSCQNYAERNNWDVVEIFREEGMSAKFVHTRPEMRRLLQYCSVKKNYISKVIVYKMDRFARNVEDGLVAISLLAKNGTSLVSSTEATEENPMGRAMRTILITLAQLDNELKGERVKDNMRTKFQKGYWCWKLPIGYLRPEGSKEERRNKIPILHKKLSEIVKLLFIKASSGYFSKKQLADYMNNLGFRDYYGEDADGKTVLNILSNTFYYGLMYARKWDEYQWGLHEKLVEKDVREKAFYNTLRKKRMLRHQDSNLFPLKGLLRCVNCDHPMTSSNPKGRGKNYLCYECHKKECKHQERIGLEEAGEQFLSILSSLKPSKRVLLLFNKMVFVEWDKTIEIAKKEAKLKDEEIEKLEGKLTVIAESNSKGILNDEEAKKRAEDVRRDLTVLKMERSDVRIEQYNTEAVRNFTENFFNNLKNLWLELDLPQKQALQSQIFPKGVVCQNKEIRTTELSPSFELINALKDENFDLVTPLEFESKFVG